MDREPGHLLSGDGDREEHRERPEDQEFRERLDRQGEHRANSDDEADLDAVVADERDALRKQAESRDEDERRSGQQLLLQLSLEGVIERAAKCEDQRQELVDGQEHEIVVVRLAAARDGLLAEPVIQRAPRARPEAAGGGAATAPEVAPEDIPDVAAVRQERSE